MHFYHLISFSLASLCWHAVADVVDQGQAEEHAPAKEPGQAEGASSEATPEHIFDTGKCPTSPKLVCSDPLCKGFLGILGNFDQFTCTSRSPGAILGHPSVAFRCPCCPSRIDMTCTNSLCDAAPGSRTCRGETLRYCPCMTNEERAAVAVSPLPLENPTPVQLYLNEGRVAAPTNIYALWQELLDIRRERGQPGIPVVEEILRRARQPPGGNGTGALDETVTPGDAGEMGAGNSTEGGSSGGARPAGDQVSSAFGRLPTGVGYIECDLRKM